MKTVAASTEQMLIGLDVAPADGLSRIALGYATAFEWERLFAPANSGWTLLLCLMVTLVLVRLIPAVLRKVIPFSPKANQIWMERRLLAKRFDSYQWRKLLWIGLGLALYASSSAQVAVAPVLVTAFCIGAGAIGFWRFRQAQRQQWPAGIGTRAQLKA